MSDFSLLIIFFLPIYYLSTILHELGHAIPALVFTKDRVTVFLGSYGDENRSFKFSIGKLDFWVLKNLLRWRGGLVRPAAKKISINHQIIYVLFGPLSSLILAQVIWFILAITNLNESLTLFLVLFFSWLTISSIMNLIPRKKKITLFNGNQVPNDGARLLKLIRARKIGQEAYETMELFKSKNYKEAGQKFDDFLDKGIDLQDTYYYAILSFILSKNYIRAEQIQEVYEKKYKLRANDYINSGYIKIHLKQYEQALIDFNKSLELEPLNTSALNNKGYTLSMLERYSEALEYLNKAIELAPGLADAYTNRGAVRVKMGQEIEGLDDINHSIKLDEKNADGYNQLGIYYFGKNEYNRALNLFQKAKQFDVDIPQLDYYLSETMKNIG